MESSTDFRLQKQAIFENSNLFVGCWFTTHEYLKPCPTFERGVAH